MDLLLLLVALLAGVFAGDAFLTWTHGRLQERLGTVEISFRTDFERLEGGVVPHLLLFLLMVGGAIILIVADAHLAWSALLAAAWGVVAAGLRFGLQRLLSKGVVVVQDESIRWRLGRQDWSILRLDEPFEKRHHRELIEVVDTDPQMQAKYHEVEYIQLRQGDVDVSFAHTVAAYQEGSHPEELKIRNVGDKTTPALFLDAQGDVLAGRIAQSQNEYSR